MNRYEQMSRPKRIGFWVVQLTLLSAMAIGELRLFGVL